MFKILNNLLNYNLVSTYPLPEFDSFSSLSKCVPISFLVPE